jgi:FtsZ-binding cell division protein ZapB
MEFVCTISLLPHEATDAAAQARAARGPAQGIARRFLKELEKMTSLVLCGRLDSGIQGMKSRRWKRLGTAVPPTLPVWTFGEKDFAMSNELIAALETRVTSAVDTIEGLRSEVRVLKEERQLLEAKLRELLRKIEGVENGNAQASSYDSAHSSDPGQSHGIGTMGSGHSPTEY